MDVLDTLKGGLAKVEEGWVTGYLGVDKEGNPTDPNSADAAKWCVGGAFIATTGSWGRDAEAAMAACVPFLPENFEPELPDPWMKMVRFNNDQHYADPVIEVIKKAIAAKEKELVPA